MSSVKNALKKWCDEHPEEDPTTAKVVKLIGCMPPLQKLDPAVLGTLKGCEQLSLSTNMIDRLPPLPELPQCRVLSLGRNKLTKIQYLNVLPALEELWVSYNGVRSVDGIVEASKLTTLYISNNKIASWDEVAKLGAMPHLRDVLLVGNPIYDQYDSVAEPEAERRLRVLSCIPQLEKIDGKLVTPEQKQAIAEQQLAAAK